MSIAKHTPGPWVVWAGTNLVIRLHSGADRSEDLRICEVSTNTRKDEGRHNARLIASAPDLLAELQKAHDLLHLALRHIPNRELPRFVEASERAGLGTDGAIRHHERAAVIAAATGEKA